MHEPGIEFHGPTTPTIEALLRRELGGRPAAPGGGSPRGDEPFAAAIRDTAFRYNLDPVADYDQARSIFLSNLSDINLYAEQFGLSAEAAAALFIGTDRGVLTAGQAGDLSLGGGAGTGDALGSARLAETQRNNAFNRVQAKLRLLMATDELQEERRINVSTLMLEALPLMVNPGTDFQPGFEPGGAATRLSNLLGFDFEPQRLPTTELPLNELLNAPTAVTPGLIEQQLGVLQ